MLDLKDVLVHYKIYDAKNTANTYKKKLIDSYYGKAQLKFAYTLFVPDVEVILSFAF